MNFALTGVPLGLFVLFTLVVAIFSILVGLILGLLAAVLFIVFAVGVALAFVLPAVLFTTTAACFLFLWGLGGYYILRWANGGDKPAEKGQKAVGDYVNDVTGGRLTGFMDAARDERAKGDISGYNDTHTKPKKPEDKPQQNGSVDKQAQEQLSKATKATGVDGVQSKADTVTGTAKGALSGATGLG
jgi:hypothetical protein